MKLKITLRQLVSFKSAKDDPTYEVVSLTNILEPRVGSQLKKHEVEELLKNDVIVKVIGFQD